MFSIIIPTLQLNKFVLNKLLDELIEEELVGEIILIENSLKGFESKSDKIKIVIPQKNLFVNPSWNYGISIAKYDYFGLINDDIIIPKNLIKQIYEFLNTNEDIGLVGSSEISRIKYEEEEFNSYPKNSKCEFEQINRMTEGWGVCIFGKKENYFIIPRKLKVFYGDDYLFDTNIKNNKKNFKIEKVIIKHLVSLSSQKFEIEYLYEDEIYKLIKNNKSLCIFNIFIIMLKVLLNYIKIKIIYFIYIILLKLGIKEDVKKFLKKLGYKFDE